jgi:hypothetical protein
VLVEAGVIEEKKNEKFFKKSCEIFWKYRKMLYLCTRF